MTKRHLSAWDETESLQTEVPTPDTWHRQRKAQNREELIEAGRILFFERGFPHVAIKDVCEEAGISRVTYYKHFQSIDELAFEVQMRALEHMDACISSADVNSGLEGDAQGVSATGAERLERMLEAWSRYAADHREYMKFILLFDLHYDAYPPERSLLEGYHRFIQEKKEQHFLNGALKAGTEDGSLQSDLDHAETAEFVFTAMMGLLQKLSLPDHQGGNSGAASARIAQRFITMILGSLQ
ncbi:hypothetical protein B9G55_08795 [Saccharibacillus sp. O16]|nr:hypothetical protein B9G55_08795 [Saccharibacillus sp. O16]